MKQFSYKKIGIIFLLLFQLSLIEVFAQTPSKIELEYFTIENTPLYIINTNDIDLAIRYKKGQGIPIVFIHGSWDDHNSWLPVAEELIKTTTNPIILYDRRGHSASSPDKEQGTISMDVQDAVSLLDALQIKKAHFIGHSYGANITIELANNHANRVESIVLYEPPIFGMLKGQTEYKQILSEVQNEMQKSKTLLEQGHIEQGTFNFIEKVAFGKGSWYSVFDQRARNTMTASYTTWLDQANDPERLNIKPEILNQFNGKITLITGSDSILVYTAVAKTIKQKVNSIELQTIQGAGHGGLISHPKQTAHMITTHLNQL
ncbi:hypothetical protein HMPREF9714_01993 [Myroides odoratimimus CCUG 12901]|uniref:AB hydrolase-1 domain-containing protein n=2 Tax=Myroides odoratimimus TaxID=76832 RepID=A0ABN0E6T2_9FLAO|nr:MULTISPECIES: alpha/beta hydrolase [Myroides]EHO06199.1 hypothetical protein HMPREF9712_03262 [Myroides odoratimimus CCUG 10230]EHO09020.1 hypothetical protein HMPREF9714_01993 [Myroides odoratimimus CCUG 12901]MDM1521468.1 alpha/beta hydrolase [Myroides odoratimimus]